jgi:DNA-binding response OmpR family regulator
MRAMVVDVNTLSGQQVSDALSMAGFNIVGPARSSGEAYLLAQSESLDIVVLSMDLEAIGAGHRLAHKLQREFQVPSVMTNEHAGPHDATPCALIVEDALRRRRRHA